MFPLKKCRRLKANGLGKVHCRNRTNIVFITENMNIQAVNIVRNSVHMRNFLNLPVVIHAIPTQNKKLCIFQQESKRTTTLYAAIMFGFGGKKSPEPEPESSYSYEEPSRYDSYAAPNNTYEAPPSASSSASVGVAEVQGMLMEEQQRALIQQAISKITAIAWDKCSASKPDSELSSREKDCIKNVTLAYLDTSMFVVHRLNKSNSA